MRTKPDLGFWKLWNLSFGFFGVQIAYALQSANVSRIFATIGADPHDLSYFWILPPLMGMIVQPIVGSLSDKTWNRFGRRLPYLIVGAVAAVIVMCLLPNAGSFGLTISGAIIMGLIALMLLDTSINMAMQPFKMLVGDMVNEKQKGKAYSIQSFLCNAGSIVGFIFPFCLAWIGIESTAPEGVVPPSVAWSFYIGAAILILCVIYSLAKIKEWPPQLYNEYNGVEEVKEEATKEKSNVIKLLAKAPSTFWTVSIVQFFCWIAFLFMWTYTTGAIATKAFDTPTVDRVTGLNISDANGNNSSFSANYILVNDELAVEKGKIVNENAINDLSGNVTITTASIFTKDKQTGKMVSEDSETKTIADPKQACFSTKKDLDTTSKEYNAAGDWVGILFAVQAVGSVVWAVMLPKIGSRKFSYSASLIIGGIGFILTGFISNQYLLFIPFLMIGCAWAAMLAWPFTIVTNSLKGGNIGTYLGLFNCSICLPQIVGALLGGHILSLFSVEGEVAPQYVMMIVAGVSLIIGSLCVGFIKEGTKE